jgi:hypothetical protein
MSKQIPQELSEYLTYDPPSGALTWIRKTGTKVVIGGLAGGVSTRGYLVTKFNGSQYFNHRIAWFLHTGEQPPDQIDRKSVV